MVPEPIEVVVKLVPIAAEQQSPAYRAVQECAARIGVSIHPLYPSTSDPELSTYFIAHVDQAVSSSVVEQLLACEGVEGAYAKPRGEPPG